MRIEDGVDLRTPAELVEGRHDAVGAAGRSGVHEHDAVRRRLGDNVGAAGVQH